LSSYPGLLSWINSKKNAFQGGNAGSFHCSLALEGDYYANFGQTLQNCQLSTAITREIKARTPTAKSYSGNPAHIALGVQYSYVMVCIPRQLAKFKLRPSLLLTACLPRSETRATSAGI